MATQVSAVTGKKPKSNILDMIRAQAPLVTQDRVLSQQHGLQQEQQDLNKQSFELEKAQQVENIAATKRREDLQRMQGEEALKQGRIATGINVAGTAFDAARTVDQLGGAAQVGRDIVSGAGKAVAAVGSFFKAINPF